jgi:hypothetical protein
LLCPFLIVVLVVLFETKIEPWGAMVESMESGIRKTANTFRFEASPLNQISIHGNYGVRNDHTVFILRTKRMNSHMTHNLVLPSYRP